MAKVWFVTGSSRGLGRAVVEAALSSGASVIATARSVQSLDALAETFGPDRFLALTLGVTKESEVINAIRAGHQKFGRIDVVVNNAGYANTAALEDMDIQDFRQQMDTNFMGVVYVTKAVIPILREQGSGHIFQVSSIGGRLGTPGLSAYQSAKWAVGGFSTVVAQELAPLGIKVTVLEPGGIRTDWAGSSMKIDEVSEPYERTVGVVAQMLRGLSGSEESLPEKIAQIIVNLSEEKDAPLRLVLGPQAVEFAAKAAEELTASDQKWQDVSLSSARAKDFKSRALLYTTGAMMRPLHRHYSSAL
ncbi:Oxidoreductase boa17 [Coniochaeta pulveracea]|uniref:Oxidoreductase boa17 n=1 Tax=Coniochaeta pulveracea TaxID=177199 RepID=A0A420YNZ0_9PEZI|nr:Oxidoreductase boa17 [Coniochaeta pulveracea]